MARVDLRSAKDIEFVTRKGRRQRLRAARVAVVCLVAAGSLVPMTLLAPAAAAYSTPTVAAGTPALAAPAAAPQAAPAPLAAPAPAPAGNELNGVVWLDLDGDGINDATETGFTGAVVTLRDGTGAVVATLTTTSTGLYSFTGLPPGQGPYSLTITRSTTTYPDPSNWVISAPPGPDATPYVGTDNDATAGSDPRVGTIANAVPGTSYDIAIRPRPELSLGFFGPGIIDGTGPFNTLGGCTSATAMGQPGDDCGTSNSQLRTGDTLTTVWSITADNFEPGTTSWGDVVFEQTIVPTGGAVATFTSIPVSCVPPPNGTGGTGSPASAILTNYPTAGQTTLRCNLGQFVEGGQESLTTAIKLSALSPNGSSFTTTEKVYAAATGDRAVPAIGPTVGPIIASARPAYDLVKLGFRSQRPEVRCVDTDSNPATPCENLQGYTLDTLIRLTAAQKVGIEAIQQPFTFTDTVSAQLNGGAAYPVEYYVAYCYANDSGWGDVVLGRPYGRTPISDPIYYPRTVDESGTCTATRPSGATTTTPYSMSITGADLDGSRFPSATWGGTDLSAGPFILAEHRVGIFIPFRSVDATDGTTNGAGSLQLFNRYSGFDPAGVSGTSNYGTGFEPGYCHDSTTPCNPTTSTVATSNNVIGPNSILLSTSGSMSKYQMYRADNWGSYTIQPGSAATHDGAGLTEPGDYTASWINFTNSGSNDVINPGVCDIFDNTVWKLATADKVKFNTLQPPNPTTTYAYVTRLNQLDTTYTSPFTVAWPSNFRVEYAHLPISGDDPLYNAARVPVAGVIDSTPFAGVDTFNTATGRYEGVWTSQKAQRCTDGAAVGGWQTDPAAVPGGVDGVNAVRFVSVDPNFILKPTAYIRAIVPMQTRSTFNGGPYAGQVIPAGTVFADLGLVRADNLNYGGALGNWRPADYQPSPETTHVDGDRSTLSRFNSLLQKHTLTPLTNVGATTSTLAGNQIVWELIPAVQTKLSPSAEIAKNVVITDVLPPYTTYNAACTAALNNSTATATILPVNVELNTGMTGPQAGYTRLTYQLGDLPVNVAIPRIRICTDTDPLAPNGTSVMNVARLTATDDITALSLRQDDHTIILEQNGSMQIGKTVDRRLDPLNDTQVYTVEYANFATAFTINPPTMIDVFPWNGDVLGSLSERDPASNYHGSLTLTAAPTVTWKNGSVPGATDPYAAIGTFYYTKDASSTVNYNPDANTSRWCSTADGGATWTPQAPAVASDCPTSFAAVTAFKFVSNYVLDIDGKPRQGQKITFTLKATDNQPADRYTNRATVDTTSLPATQFLRSNNVIVQVPSYNLGDLIFGDLNRNGTYEAAADLRAPAGVVVDLYQAGQTPGVDAPYRTTTTNANGRYQFTLLGDGDYFVVVPASQFVVGGPLASWVLDPAGLQADPNTNLNDTGDHHAIGLTSGTVADGIRSSGTIRLSATVPANPLIAPTGDEPLGDNTGNLPSAVSDDFTNYTLDLGLIPPSTPSVALKKFTNGQDADTPTGPNIPVGGAVLWRYELRNTGDRPMVGVSITDDAGTPATPADDWTMTKASGYVSGDTDNDGALDLTEVWVFQRTGVAVEGQYANLAAVTAQAADNANQPIAALGSYTDDDPSHYWGLTSGLTMKKYTNGLDADTVTGPLVAIGSTVTWTYVVTNTGNTLLTATVVDDKIADDATINCGQGTANVVAIAPSGSVTCTATGTAISGQYANTGTATATAPSTYAANGTVVPGVVLTAADPSHYFGSDPKIQVVKKINGDDANTTPGVRATTPGTLTVTFVVTNTGNVTLDPVTVTDSVIAADQIVCPTKVLAAGASMTCLATYPAPAAGVQHSDTATVTGTPPLLTDGTRQPDVTDTDDAHAWGDPKPDITITKFLNGLDANTAPGPQIVTGDTVNVSFLVTNSGNTRLDSVTVTDSVVSAASISCPKTSLAIGESMTCTGTFIAPAPLTQHTNTGSVVGTPVLSDGIRMIDLATGNPVPVVRDTDPAYAATVQPGMYVVKKINGQDANTAPGVLVVPGSTMQVDFTVFNIGSTRLEKVTVSDDTIPGPITCTPTALDPGQSATCSATYAAPAVGVQHTNTATATATPIVNGAPITPITDTDPANAAAANPMIQVVKKINGQDANDATTAVPTVAGATMTVTFEVENTGNTTLIGVTVTDDVIPAGAISCPDSVLDVGETMTCTAEWAAPAVGQPHTDLATVSGTPTQVDGQPIIDPATGAPMSPVDDKDPATTWTPAHPAVTIVKAINGDDADAAPGVSVAAGSPMAVTFLVTNTGDVRLSPIVVTDSDATTISCPVSSLEPGGSTTCTASIPAPAIGGGHVDTAKVVGSPVQSDGSPALGADGKPLDPVSASNSAHAFVAARPGITVVKTINTDDANSAPGVSVVAGAPLAVKFVVTNTGDVRLAPVTLTDDPVDGLSCQVSELAPGASMECTGTLPGLAAGATHLDTATATGTPVLADGTPVLGVDGLPIGTVQDTDPAYAFAPATAGVTIVKSLNGDDANTAPGVSVAAGAPVTVTFVVTNTGSSFLANVTVTDSLATGITCPGADPATPNVIPLLGPAGSGTASVTCTGTVAALAAGATHVDTGSVSGTPVLADGSTPALGADGLPLPPPSDTDDAYAFAPATAGVTIVKSLNGDDANTAPGVSVAAGAPLSVTFLVTNTGTAYLANVTVTDSLATGITCPGAAADTANVIPLLGPAGSDTASVTCTGTVAALAPGATHVNTGSVSGTPVLADGSTPALGADGLPLPPPTDTDDAYAFAPATSGVSIMKSINGDDANTAPGVSVAAGAPLSVTFVVTNTGSSYLANVTVTDPAASGITCPQSLLAPGDSMECTATILALEPGEKHKDVGFVTGKPTLSDGVVPAVGADGEPLDAPTAFDPAHAFAPASAGVSIVKSLNGDDANTAPGVSVVAGSPVTVTFVVTNTGTSFLANVTVTDSLATAITCPGADPATPNVIPLLGPAGSGTASVTCSGTVAALAPGATHVDTGSVSGTPVLADGTTPAVGADGAPLPPPSDTDDAHAFAPASAGVSIVKSLNGDDANAAPGVSVVAGSPVTVTFVVSNTGTSFLANVTVTDSLATGITCPGAAAGTANVIPLLGPAGSDTASVTCTGTVAALAAGATHVDTGSVSGTPVLADGSTPALGADGLPLPPPSDTDDAYAFAPATSGVSIVKSLNGDDANTAPGVSVVAGSPVTVTFVVTNTGTSFLANVTVTDSLATGITCAGAAADTANVIPLLGPAGSDTASVTCTGTVAALAAGATHVDTGSVSGTPVLADGSTPAVGADGLPLPPPSDTDDAYAFAPATSGVTIVKSLNGDDANTAPGVSVAAGAPVTVTFVVTNTGTSFLANVTVTDSLATGITCPGAATDTANVIPLLGPAGSDTASVTCTGTVAALAAGATHVNTGSVSGTPTLADGSTPAVGADGAPLPPPSDTDDAYAFAPATSGVTIVKSLNGDDANTAPGVSVAAGAPLSVTFVVTNTGTSFLANVTVTDSLATGITCPGAATDTANVIPLLGPAGSDTASVTCTGTVAALAPGATHVDTGSVSGTPTLADGSTPAVGADGAPLPPPTDTDDAYAFAPATSGVTIVKSLNGDDANTAPGVSVAAGAPVAVTFVVSNTGTSYLANVRVTDSLATGITCHGAAAGTANVIPLLGPAGSDTASVTCTGTVAALAAGATHVDTGSVSGTPTLADGSTPAVGADAQPLQPPTDTDDAHAFAPASAGVSIVKSLNGDDANTAPGVSVVAGSPVAVTFVVSNTGTSYLANVTVTDSLATGITCPGADPATPNVIPLLGPAGSSGVDGQPSAVATCTGTVAALAAGATHVDTGSVSGTPVLADGSTPALGADGLPLPPPSNTDDAYAFAPATAGVTIVKSLNDDDANTAPGVSVVAGSPVTVTFVVTNTGTAHLANVTVTDSLATGITCPGAAADTANVIPLLGPAGSDTASVTCTGTVAALAPGATHVDTGSVSGTPVLADGTTPAVGADGQPLPPSTATDDAHAYAPAHPGIGVVKRINGDDAATAPGVSVPAGSLMMVTFEVTNTGDVRIDPVVLTDSTVTEIRCPAAALDPGEVMTCSANLAAPAVGTQHSNTVTASGTPVLADGTPAVGEDGLPAPAPQATDTAYAISVATPLPQTGANVTGLVGSGLGMLLLGWLLLLASPRRRGARSRRS